MNQQHEQANHDCLAKRRPGEPYFVLLGRDPDAHHLVRLWGERRLNAGGDSEHVMLALQIAADMKQYSENPDNAPKSAPKAEEYEQLSFNYEGSALQPSG